ncbi:hypothetical protein [Spirosoma sp. KNUC1025]|uniref:hypothetical protein n=1 Tax=Spirosoma sp. KNUC1025 TaxID=2894082 RepID=UPI00386ADB54|nr:hypothetical protein LN737_19435 [Spirosoma sp. KNUC1025]
MERPQQPGSYISVRKFIDYARTAQYILLYPYDVRTLYRPGSSSLVYYRRITCTGWQVILENKVPKEVKQDKLHERQREAYQSALRIEELIG